MKFRKLTAVILTLIMAVSMFSVSALAAGPTFRGDEIEAKAGETITYNVYIDNNPGIAGYMVQVDFDPDTFALEAEDEDDGFDNPVKIKMGDFSLDNDSWGNVVSNTTKYGCLALYFNTENVNKDGVIFKVILKVKEDAVNGEHAVKIRYTPQNTISLVEKVVDGKTKTVTERSEPFTTVDGSVTVTGGTQGEIDNSKVGPTEEELAQMEAGTLTAGGNPTTTKTPGGLTTGGTETGKTGTTEIDPVNQPQTPGSDSTETGTTGTTEETGSEESAAVDNTDASAGTAAVGDGTGLIDSTTRNVTGGSAGGLGTTQLLLIIAAAVVLVAVIVIVVLRASQKKKVPAGAAPEEDEDLDINEVMGWNSNEDDYNEDDDDDVDD